MQFDYGCLPEAEFCLAQRNRSLSDIRKSSYVLQFNNTVIFNKGVEFDLTRCAGSAAFFFVVASRSLTASRCVALRRAANACCRCKRPSRLR